MDAATAGVIATAVVGLAGTAAAFFAPTWSQSKLEQRRERREFRQGRRLVADELARHAAYLGFQRQQLSLGKTHRTIDFPTPEWNAHRASLAANLPTKIWDEVSLAYHRIEIATERKGIGKPFLTRPSPAAIDQAEMYAKEQAEAIGEVIELLRKAKAIS